jgi:hypothetical protein
MAKKYFSLLLLLFPVYLWSQKKIPLNSLYPSLHVIHLNKNEYKFNLGLSNNRTRTAKTVFYSMWIEGRIMFSEKKINLVTTSVNNDTCENSFTTTSFYTQQIKLCLNYVAPDSLVTNQNLNGAKSSIETLTIVNDSNFQYSKEKVLVLRIAGIDRYIREGIHDGFTILYSLKRGIIGTYNYYITTDKNEIAWNFTGSKKLLHYLQLHRFHYSGIGLFFL